MKRVCLYCSLLFVFLFLMFFLVGCDKDGDAETTQDYVYIPSGENASSTTGSDSVTESDSIAINTSWKNNYEATYSYYNSEQTEDELTVCEKRSDNYFSAEDMGSGDILYYAGGDSGVDSYVIVNGEDEQVHSVIENKSLSDLSSTFMKLSEVDSDLPSLTNVMYMYDESVAGRDCSKYIQRAYTDGELTKTVYVWVDKEFGFASRGEVYDENNIVTASWQLIAFSSGETEDSDVKIDLSKYKFIEE